MEKGKEKLTAMVDGKVVSLSPEQTIIYNKTDLWSLSTKELTDKALETTDSAVRKVIVKIIDYMDRAKDMTEADKVRVKMNSSLLALETYLGNFIVEHSSDMAFLMAESDKERARQGKEPKDSTSFGTVSRSFVVKVDGIDFPVTISAGVSITKGVGKRTLKKFMADVAFRLAMQKQASERQAEIDRIWNLYEQENVENKDRW